MLAAGGRGPPAAGAGGAKTGLRDGQGVRENSRSSQPRRTGRLPRSSGSGGPSDRRSSDRHLRELLRAAAAGESLAVPADCGGSFLSLRRLHSSTMDLLLGADLRGGQVFNLASGYVTWKEIARLVLEVTGSAAPIRVVPRCGVDGGLSSWPTGGTGRPTHPNRTGVQAHSGPAGLRLALRDAIAATWKSLRR